MARLQDSEHDDATQAGVIHKIFYDKGFGFIRAADRDLFFHRSGCGGQFDSLKEGDHVTFDEEESQKGPRATHVTRSN